MDSTRRNINSPSFRLASRTHAKNKRKDVERADEAFPKRSSLMSTTFARTRASESPGSILT